MCTENSVLLHTFCSKSRTFQFARNLSNVAPSMNPWYIANQLPATYIRVGKTESFRPWSRLYCSKLAK